MSQPEPLLEMGASRALSSQYHDGMGCLGGGAGRNSTYPILQFYSICLHRQFGRVSWRLE